ncbi:MAG TPA: NUDIX hydrolase [Chloroflexia bacterium]|nr:NUDIX hydrolase [Chloroflexia bacterium]
MNKQQSTRNEYSAGGVVFRLSATGTGWDIVAVQRARHGDWSLPKGHLEAGETREQAAIREVKEESGIDARIISSLGETDYFFRTTNGGLVHKTVYHFLLEATSDTLGGPNWEVSESRWVNINEANNLLTYAKDIDIVARALTELRRGEGQAVSRTTDDL